MPEPRARTRPAGGRVSAGRLGATTSAAVRAYTADAATDQRLLPDDVAASLAHAAMLHAVGLLTREEHRDIERGLHDIAAEVDAGTFSVRDDDEDIHMAVERRLVEIAGGAGSKLHTGRSRNDQVVTDLRLYARRACRDLMLGTAALQDALVHRAEEQRSTPMPGYTHMQRAQPVSVAHHLLAYVEMLQRDISRLAEARVRCDVLPLGSGALAGSSLPLDRQLPARSLGFAAISANSLDAVSDRDFAVDICSACALLMVHLSRLSEEIVLWSSAEFGFVDLPDTHATGSSLMPQKKNPDVAELARGRTGHVVGALVALLTTLKGLPLAYNRDLQEDKRALFTAIDVTMATLAALADLVGVLHFDTDTLAAAAGDPQLLATDAAEYLVQHGVAFRDAHHLVGELVRRTIAEGRTLRDLTQEEWRAASPAFAADITEIFDLHEALRRRELPGGPGPRSVAHQLARATDLIDETRRRLGEAEDGR